jgi:hypothetical protein
VWCPSLSLPIYHSSMYRCLLTSSLQVYVQEIVFGHWAYCTNLRKQGIAKQYEVHELSTDICVHMCAHVAAILRVARRCGHWWTSKARI